MKLSQMTTDQSADVFVLIAAEIQDIMSDNILIEKIQKIQKTDDKSQAVKVGIVTTLDIATYLLKSHRQATWNILGALNQKTAEEIGKQFLPLTIKQITEMIQDKDLLSFFTPPEPSEPVTLSVI